MSRNISVSNAAPAQATPDKRVTRSAAKKANNYTFKEVSLDPSKRAKRQKISYELIKNSFHPWVSPRFPFVLQKGVISYLDQKTFLALASSSRSMWNVTQNERQFLKTVNTKELYSLLALDLPHSSLWPKSHYEDALRVNIERQLDERYTFDDPGVLLRSRGYTARKYNLIKLSGIPMPTRKEIQKMEPDTALAELERLSSPYRFDEARAFPITTVAAKILCAYITKTEIDSLMIGSFNKKELPVQLVEEEDEKAGEEVSLPKEVWQNSFGNEVAKIFANELPANRMVLLHILGGFGDEGMRALTNNVNRLFESVKIDPKDIVFCGFEASKKEENSLNAQMNALIKKKQQNQPDSVIQARDPCVIM